MSGPKSPVINSSAREMQIIAESQKFVVRCGRYRSHDFATQTAARVYGIGIAHKFKRGIMIYAQAESYGIIAGALAATYNPSNRAWKEAALCLL